jgi:hypothetical protein
VEKGADPNHLAQNGTTALCYVVFDNSAESAQFLLDECHADPNICVCIQGRGGLSPIDLAIGGENLAMVSLLLSRNAIVVNMKNCTKALVALFNDAQLTRRTKLEVCRVLKAHHDDDATIIRTSTTATTNQDATAATPATTTTTTTTTTILAASFQLFLKCAIATDDRVSCSILFESGMNHSGEAMHVAIQIDSQNFCQWLVEGYHVDPFVVVQQEPEEQRPRQQDAAVVTVLTTPFQAAAHQETWPYFVDLWNEKRCSLHDDQQQEPDGDNNVLDLFCRDRLVSFQAIEFLVQRDPILATQKNALKVYIRFKLLSTRTRG